MQRMRPAFVLLLGAGMLLASCTLQPQPDTKKDEAGKKSSDLPKNQPEATSRFIPGMVQDPNAQHYHVTTSAELAKIDNGSEEELIWTDPDNPEASIDELNAAFEKKAQNKGWLSNLPKGMHLARRSGLPLIVWLHDSVISPKSKKLSTELLDTERFNAWCSNRAVRVKIDSGDALDDHKESRYSLSGIKQLQHRFGVSKRPAIVIFSPQGKIVERIDGYSGMTSEVEIGIRNGITLANEANEKYCAKLLSKGYREWKSKRGEKLFAKLQRYDEKGGMVYLKEAGGRVSRTKLSRFCKNDIEYLDELARSGRVPH